MAVACALLALVGLVALGVAFASGARGEPARPHAPEHGGGDAPAGKPDAATAVAPVAPAATDGTRAATSQPAGDDWPREFASGLHEDGVDPQPARDGLTFVVLEPDGSPVPRLPIRVEWRKGFGLYGCDRGSTDGAGAFVSTVHGVEQVESLHVLHRELGELRSREDVLPSAADPDRVVLVLPELARLDLRVVDLDGAPVARAMVELAGRGERPPREVALAPLPVAVATDDDGRATTRMPVGVCIARELTATGCIALEQATIRVPRGGTSAVLTMLRVASRRQVDVTVALPPGSGEAPQLRAFSLPLPDDIARRHGLATDQEQRRFVVRPDGARWQVDVDPLPWRLVAQAAGCRTALLDQRGDEASVHVVLERAPPDEREPRARLVVTVVTPAGEPVSGAEVRIHDTPDLVHGASWHTDRDGRFVHELEPGARVCVSAANSGFARGFAGPFDLAAGERQVTVRLREALAVRGRVVDEAGRPIQATVVLHRPADALRTLGDAVPAILPTSGNGDTRGTAPDGAFRFEGLYAGEHELVAFADGGGHWPARARAMPGADVTLQLGQGLGGLCLLTVTVVDDATGAPLPGCDVKDLGTTDGRGVVRAAMPPQDDLPLECWAKGYEITPSGPHRLRPGPQELALRVRRSAPVFVRLIDASGEPIHGADVMALDDAGQPRDLMDQNGVFDGVNARTDRAGRTTMRGLPAGALRLRVERGDATHEVDLPAGAGRDDVFEVRWPR